MKDRNLIISILLNNLITAAQIVGGLISGSLGLLSDALHNFGSIYQYFYSGFCSYFIDYRSYQTFPNSSAYRIFPSDLVGFDSDFCQPI